MKKNYYEVLGINMNATLKEIKHAFKTAALKWHPDKNKNAEAEEKMKEINEAYIWLLKNYKSSGHTRNHNPTSSENWRSHYEESRSYGNKEEWKNPYENFRYAFGSKEFEAYFDENLKAYYACKITDEQYLNNMM